jgi:hypothetical protein
VSDWGTVLNSSFSAGLRGPHCESAGACLNLSHGSSFWAHRSALHEVLGAAPVAVMMIAEEIHCVFVSGWGATQRFLWLH